MLGCVYATGDIFCDPSVPLDGVDSDVNLAVAAYLQTFSLCGRTANVLLEVPCQWSTTRGILVDTSAKGSVSGFGDPAATLTVNLLGAPAMTPQDFQAMRQDPHPTVGTSLKVLFPIGTHDPNRLLNVRGNRWAITAEMGGVIPLRPKLLFEVEAGIWLLGDDDELVAGPREQEPIAGLELHLVKRFKPGFWASFDANLWALGISEDLIRRGQSVGGGDTAFSNIVDLVDTGFQLHAETIGPKLGFFADVTVIELSDQQIENLLTTDAEIKEDVDELGLILRPGGRNGRLDILGGIRVLATDEPYRLSIGDREPRVLAIDRQYWDALFGARYTLPLGQRWLLSFRGDVSFGGTEHTWTVQAAAGWRFGTQRRSAVLIGYRHRDLRYEKANVLLVEKTLSGPIVGVPIGL